MIYEYKPSFDRSFKRLPSSQQERVKKSIKALIDFFAHGQKTAGLGLKKLREPFWEIRVGLDIRVLFAIEGEAVSFAIVGHHDEIQRHLELG